MPFILQFLYQENTYIRSLLPRPHCKQKVNFECNCERICNVYETIAWQQELFFFFIYLNYYSRQNKVNLKKKNTFVIF